MTHDYRIEKARVPVIVTTRDGERLVGDVFVQLYARHRMGQEEPGDMLNGAEPYFPMVLAQGGSLLVAKTAVREVEVPEPAQMVGVNAGVRLVRARVALVGGLSYDGCVHVETPDDRPRLLDFLNRLEDRFLALHGAQGARLLNREIIVHIRQLD